MAETRLTPARLVLGAAGLIALAAVCVAMFRDRGATPSPANSQAAQAPAGNVEDLIRRLEKRMQGNASDADGWRMLGWAYFATGHYAESANAYSKATAIDPKKAEYWSALGEATVLAEKDARVSPTAEQAFRRAILIDVKDIRARYFLAVKRDMDGDHRGAVDDWIALLKEAPTGAPWAADVRQLVTKVAGDNRIDIAGRLPPGDAQAAPMPNLSAGPSLAVDAANADVPGPTREQMQAAAALPPSQQDAMVQGMVNGLAARLASNPKDPDGWIRLIRARMVLSDTAAARQALAAAKAANPGSAARLDEAAKALGLPEA